MITDTYWINRRNRMGFSFIATMSMILLFTMVSTPDVVAETTPKNPAVVEPASEVNAAPATKPVSKLEDALKKLKLPGVTINLKERCVDVDATICLDEGALELIACTKDTKEHESLIAVEATPKNIHTALLLIGAKPGNPAMQKPTNKEKTQWMHVPPRGGPVDISIVYKNKQGKEAERPIRDFLEPFEGYEYDEEEETAENKEKERFPTNTFLFAGSFLHGKGEGPRIYVADMSGHVISLATFGDELLCLPGIHAHTAGALAWQVDSTHLPELGAKVKLRLRPKTIPANDAGKVPVKQQ